MNNLPRWIAFASAAAVLVLAGSVRALTDSNADLKEAAAAQRVPVIVPGKAALPARVAWVPASPKKLDGFKPVLPPDAQDPAPKLAEAGMPARAKR
jgi:hypothetical protein